MDKTFEITYSEPGFSARDVLTLEARDAAHARLLALCILGAGLRIYGVREKPQG